MVLYLIGLGLGHIDDLSVNGMNTINGSHKLYLFASIYYPFKKEILEEYLCREIVLIHVDNFEKEIAEVALEVSIAEKKDENIALLMPGNPFCENRYPQIKKHCDKLDVSLKIIHNASYLNLIGNTGIQLYKFGETLFVSGCKKEDLEDYFQVINYNLKQNLNTLIIFRHDVSNKLASELIAAISNIKDEDTSLLNSKSKVVLIYKEGCEKFFYSGDANVLFDVVNTKTVLTAAVCAEFDCMEAEYLRELQQHYSRCKSTSDCSKPRGNFHLIGLGLGKPQDITLRGQKLIEASSKVFLEGYTSIMFGGKEDLEKFFGKEIVVADREMVEQTSDKILDPLFRGDNVAFLVVGDPFGATTHADIVLRALGKASDISIANNASILNAIGLSCLKPRRFGGTVSIPFWTDSYKPDSFYDKICLNRELGRHTLCLLDIQVKEQSFENLARGRKIYEKPRYMSSPLAAKQLLEIKVKRSEEGKNASLLDDNTEVVSLNRIATMDEEVSHLLLGYLVQMDQKAPLHSLVIVGEMDEDERNAMN